MPAIPHMRALYARSRRRGELAAPRPLEGADVRRKIPLLRALAILAVVIGHAALRAMGPLEPAPGVASSLEGAVAVQYGLLFALAQLSFFAVPAFFFVTGVFCTFAIQKPGLAANAGFLRGRLKALVVPLLVWSLVAFAADFVLGIPSLSTYLVAHARAGEMEWGYYFLLAMMQIYLAAPFVVDLARRRPNVLLAASIGLHVVVLGVRLLAGLDVAGLGALAEVPAVGSWRGDWAIWRWQLYLVLGVLAGLHGSKVEAWLRAHRRPLLFGAGVGALVVVTEAWAFSSGLRQMDWFHSQLRPLVPLYACVVLAAWFSLDIKATARTAAFEKVGNLSFGLFVVHPIAYKVLARIVDRLAPGFGLQWPVAVALVCLVFGALVPYLVIAALSRSRFRGQAALVFGH
jgi:peptidoglycan/LPS O-acetylase OafA/YrhL